MSEQDHKIKLLYDLNVISKITPGHILSTSTMTIIDHNAWSTSVWRRYARENRQDTIKVIRSIFVEALSIIKISSINCPTRKSIINHVIAALKGFNFLKDTYQGDYYTIGEIDQIISTVNSNLQMLITSPIPKDIDLKELDMIDDEERVEEATLDEYINKPILTDYIKDEYVKESDNMGILDEMTSHQEGPQKIFSNENIETGGITKSESSSNSEAVVTTSNRENSPNANTATIDVVSTSDIIIDEASDKKINHQEAILPMNTPPKDNLTNEERRRVIQEKKAILIAKIQNNKLRFQQNDIIPIHTNELRHRNIESSKKCNQQEEMIDIKNSMQAKYGMNDEKKVSASEKKSTTIQHPITSKYQNNECSNYSSQKLPIIRLAAAFKQWIETYEPDKNVKRVIET